MSSSSKLSNWLDNGISLYPKSNRGIMFNTGVAVPGSNYWIGRNADATNLMQLNVPTGASWEFSVNDVAVATITTAGTITGAALSIDSGACLVDKTTMFSIANLASFYAGTANTTIAIAGNQANGATAVGVYLGNIVAFSTAGAKLISIMNATVEKANIGLGGSYNFTGTEAVTAVNYQITRNADATNLMNFNVPTGASYEFGVNDVSALTLSSTTGVFGSIALSGITTLSMNNQLTNTLADGTAPMVITSTTKVTNLNADRIDDLHASAAISASGALSITANVYALHGTGGTAVTIAHSTADGYIHLPAGGSANQILKNSGSAGTGSWGTVTENAGALAAITTLGMAGDLTNYEAVNDGNPSIFLGSATAEKFEVQSIYDGGAQTLDYVNFQTYAASVTADKGKYIWNVDGVEILQIDDDGIVMSSKMIQGAQGTDIASANDATLTLTGNYFDVTGATQINTLTATGIQAGTLITLQFDGAPLVKHATAGTGAQLQLAGSVDFSATAGDTLTLVYDGTYWREIARTAI